jgi:hypothetical protein
MKNTSRLRYLERLRQSVERSQRCLARHAGTTVLPRRIKDSGSRRQTVEMYELDGHTEALRCFAWAEPAANEYCRERFVCILDLPARSPRSR